MTKWNSTKSSKASKRAQKQANSGIPRPWGEFLGIALLALGCLTIGGLLSFQFGDGLLMGPVGRLVAGALYTVFGMAAYLLGAGIIGLSIKAMFGDAMEIRLSESLGFTSATFAGCVLLHMVFPIYRVHGVTVGGLTGEVLGEISVGLFGYAGTYVMAIAVLSLGLIASTPLSFHHFAQAGSMLIHGVKMAGVYVWGVGEGMLAALRNRPAREEVETEEEWEAEFEEEETDEVEDESEEEELGDEELQEEDVTNDLETSEKQIRPKRKKARKQIATSEVTETPRKNRKLPRKQTQDLPEIVVAEVITPAEIDPPGRIEEPLSGQESANSSPAGKSRKKAPPRPHELAERTLEIEEHAIDEHSPTPEKVFNPIPGVIRLTSGEYQLPPTKLLEAADVQVVEVDKSFVLEQAECIEHALAQFRIHGKVTTIHPGPVITRYEFKPQPGVKLSKIESLENDLAMALEAIRIRILAPIPGKATVGFEVPNKTRETVSIKEILASENYGKGCKLPLALGKNITGKPIWIDLAKSPHLLVAGATGSGKSVGINSMICSLLYACSPEEVRMIMIDPKMLELSIYKDIPHLLLPVITDADKANLALRWAVDEMERRYAILSDAQVRDIGTYNRKLPKLLKDWESEKKALEQAAQASEQVIAEEGEDALPASMLSGISIDANGEEQLVLAGQEVGPKPEKMPYIVVIIDEFADLMMVASKEVEASVARIAAKARAAGIHLLIATQRPSVDVITGTIKNNFPSRIAFQVTSDIDSRTILDQKGAKQLLGMGDMLYMDRGTQPQRVHGCFVSEDEILKVVDFIKKQAKPVYNSSITAKREDDGDEERSDQKVDPFYDRAVQIVAETQKVSTSMIQRRLNIGYNRAANIVEMMEKEGVIGPARGTTPREVYINAA